MLRGLQERFVSLGFCVQEAALIGGLFTLLIFIQPFTTEGGKRDDATCL